MRFPAASRLAFSSSLALFVSLLAASASAKPAPPKAAPAPAPAAAPADDPSASSDPGEDPAAEDAVDPFAALPWRAGPETVDLGHGAAMALPAGERFLGMPQAGDVMKKLGNLHNETLLGIVLPAQLGEATSPADVLNAEGSYLVTVRYDDPGFVKDDEKVDPAELLTAIQEGEKEDNEERVKQGFDPIHAEGWLEDPRYEKAQHQMIWALNLTSRDNHVVNLNTRVLGRRGYIAVNMITEPGALATNRAAGLALVNATRFNPGERYEDYKDGSDKLAEYGLTGLVLGGLGLGVAKVAKVGLLAAFWKPIAGFLLAAKKLVLLGFAAVAGFFRRLFGKKKNEATR